MKTQTMKALYQACKLICISEITTPDGPRVSPIISTFLSYFQKPSQASFCTSHFMEMDISILTLHFLKLFLNSRFEMLSNT
jgi:hypothetical protein